MKKLLSIVMIFLIGLLFGFEITVIAGANEGRILNDLQYANYRTLPYKIELIKAYSNYMEATETYLDEINEMCNISTGSDIHCNYLDARKKVDTLLNKEE